MQSRLFLLGHCRSRKIEPWQYAMIAGFYSLPVGRAVVLQLGQMLVEARPELRLSARINRILLNLSKLGMTGAWDHGDAELGAIEHRGRSMKI